MREGEESGRWESGDANATLCTLHGTGTHHLIKVHTSTHHQAGGDIVQRYGEQWESGDHRESTAKHRANSETIQDDHMDNIQYPNHMFPRCT